MLDLRVLAILDPAMLGGRPPVEAARAAVAGGATALQLRWKDSPAAHVVTLARAIVATVPVPVWVNDRADIAVAAGAAGVHVGQDDLPPAAVRRLAPAPFGIGVSVGTPAEAVTMRDVPADYWSIGSVFATASKPDAGAPLGGEGFTRLARLAPIGMPVIAIGGIDADRAGDVVRAGAAGVAVISAIFAADDVEAAARRLRRAVDTALVQR